MIKKDELGVELAVVSSRIKSVYKKLAGPEGYYSFNELFDELDTALEMIDKIKYKAGIKVSLWTSRPERNKP